MSTAIANQLFLAYMGRPADAAWRASTASVLNSNQPSAALQTAFYNAAVSEGVFSSTDTLSSLVNKIFLQTFGFAATTFEQTAWANSGVSKEAMAWTIFVSYLGATNVPDMYKLPTQSKLMSVDAYTNQLQNDGAANAALSQGGSAATSARTQISGVTSQATAATFITNVASNVATSSVSSGSTFTLTTGADTTSGTANNDTFNAVIGTSLGATDGTTLNPGDNISGGAGVDILSLSISGTHVAAITDSAFTLNSIETLNISNFETTGNDTTLDLSLATGVATINLSASSLTGDSMLTNVKNIVAAQMQNGSGDLGISYQTAVVAGTADAQTLLVSGVTAGTFTANGVESLAITSSGSARNVLTAITDDASLKAVTVAGTAALTMGTLGATITSLNASANTGGVTATLSATTTTAVTGSAGNDIFTSGTVLTTGSVNAGSGTDTLVSTLDTVIATSALGLKYTGFETLSLSTAAATSTDRAQDMSLVAGLTAANVSVEDITKGDAAAFANTTTMTNLGANLNTINITALKAIETANNLDTTVTVVATRATNTLADAMTVNLGSATAASGTTAVSNAGNPAQTLLNVTLANEEAITVNSLFGANFIVALDASSMTSLTATGSKALSIGALSNNTLTTIINAGTMTADFTMGTNAGTTASTISGGSGNDALTGSTKADVITGGAGNDTITAGAGADNVSGGDGDDTFTVSTITDFTLALETVSGGAGNDTLSFTEAAVTTLTAANLAAVSGIEQISIANGANAISVTLTDAVYTANGQALKIVDGSLTQGALTLDGSALAAANVVDVTANTSTTVNDSLVGGAGNDIFRFSTTAGLEAADTVTGGAGTDTIILAATAADVTAVLTNVRTVETITTTGTGFAIGITVGASTMAASTTLTTNASAQSTSTGLLTYDGALVALATVVQNVTGTGANDIITGGAGNDIIVGGSGDDAITGGLGIDNLSGGDGVDTFTVATLGAGFVGLTAAETVSGGSGNDILTFAAGTLAVASTDLLALSSIETITVQNTTQTASITLTDAVYTANGLTTLTVDNVTATSGVLTLAAGSLSAANSVKVIVSKTDNSGALSLVMGSGNDTVVIDGDAVDNGSTMTAGTGTDTLEIVRQTTAATAVIAAGITGFETVLFSTAAGTYAFSTLDASLASGITQTVNASVLTGTLLWDGSLEADGLYSITTGSGADNLTGGQKNDTISAGAGADTITGGLGADSLTGGAGADTFVYTLGSAFVTTASNATLTDTITDWASGVDKLQVTLNYGTMASPLTVDATIQTARAGTSLIQDNLSGNRGQVVYDTTGSAMYINVNADNLLTTADFKININPAATATATLVEGDINFVITGGTNGDTITAGGGADSISSGGGSDSITGGAGIDVITGGGGTDTIVVGTVQTSVDAISAFTSGTDKVRYSGTLLNNATGTLADAGDLSGKVTINEAIAVSATARQYVFSNAAFDIDAELTAFLAGPTAVTAAAVTTAAMAALNATAKTNLDATFLATETVLFILDGTVGTSGAVFSFNNSTAALNTINAGELVLVGVTDVVLVNGDIIL